MKLTRARVLVLATGTFALGIFSKCPPTNLVSGLIPSG